MIKSSNSVDEWYFGDYVKYFSGGKYNILTYSTIFCFLVAVALSTEKSLGDEYFNLYIPYTFNLVELFFISDFIGKISNTWSIYNYTGWGFVRSFFGIRQLIDFITLFLLVTDFFSNDSLAVIGLYLSKVALLIYFSKLREILNRINYILFKNPAKTFFPVTLLSIITYIMASVMYIIERNSDPEHFGSIFRAMWFSFVSVTTIGYGDVVPQTTIGKLLACIFAFSGIICVTILTANIIDMNSQYDHSESEQR
jgi:voltage-gated potassium channel